MKISLVERGRPRRLAWLIALAAALPQLFFPLVLPAHYPAIYPVLLAVVLGAFAWLVFALRIEVNRWWGMLAEQLCVAGVAAVLIHMPMYQVSYASLMALVNTAAIFLVLQLALFAIVGNGKVFGAILFTVCLVYGIVNYEVFMFTGNMISIGEILSVRTGMNVMGNYHFIPGPFIISAVILYACAMAALLRIKNTGLGRLKVRAAALLCAAVAALLPIRGYRTMKLKTWKSDALYKGIGIPLELLLELRDARISAPEGYSPSATEQLLASCAQNEAAAAGERSNVIVIMLEAFSDLSVLGDFDVSEDPLAYTRSLADESIHGSYLASTFAGGTSRTEWEFLTGNSMYWMPKASIPFKQYVSGAQNSIVRVFKNAGYHTIGMHCFDGNGWDRYKVYPLMGFDDIYFEDDLQWDGRVRKYISDSAFVHQVISLFEQNDTGKPLFLFGVTMQNHGNYEYPDFQADVHVQGLRAQCAVEDQYLSLMKRSDEAVRELIEYFRGVDEPVEIVLFGDHQPKMSDEFYQEIGVDEIGKKYVVPWLIWRNHGAASEAVELTSANYLTWRATRESGVGMPAYYAFLERLCETVPAICALGYQYEGGFYGRGEMADGKVEALLNEYACCQYANLFDDSVDPALFQGAAEVIA